MRALLILLAGFSLHQDPAVPKLLAQLRSEDITEREKADAKLRELGPDVSAALKQALNAERDPDVQARVEAILGSFHFTPVCEGRTPFLSPDGKRLAFVRMVEAGQNMRGDPAYEAETWIRDLATGKESRICEDSWPIGWTANGTVVLAKGILVSAEDGKPVEGKAELPVRGQSVAWSAGGERLAYLSAADRTIRLVDKAGVSRKIELGLSANTENHGFLSWSPDGKRLAFHLLFFRKGDLPIRKIGVVDAESGKAVFVGEGAYAHLNPGLSRTEGERCAPAAWDGKGERFAFVTGRGDGEAELYLADAAGTEALRLTDDQRSKWSPAPDPSGRRIAYCSGKFDEQKDIVDCQIRILDVLTGEEERILPKGDGTCLTLGWSPDGKRLLYEWYDEKRSMIVEARPAPPRLVPAGTKVKSQAPGSRKRAILDALASDKPAIVSWGAEAAADLKDPEVIGALRASLKNAVTKGDYTARDLIDAIHRLDARVASPELLLALDMKYDVIRIRAIGLLALWKEEKAVAPLLKLQDAGESATAVAAAVGLVAMGHENGWAKLRTFGESAKKEIRSGVVEGVGGIRDPRSVEILLDRVADSERLYWDYTGEVKVGDRAERALATLTGETFDRDPVRWKAWWKEQKGVLPELKVPNRAIEKLDERDRVKGEERQKEFRDRR